MLLRYVSGDFRFRASYSKHNPRKMVKVWAEKERRNLVRLQAAGIRSPQPLQLRSHVLIMDFIGTDGVAAPRLKVSISRIVASIFPPFFGWGLPHHDLATFAT